MIGLNIHDLKGMITIIKSTEDKLVEEIQTLTEKTSQTFQYKSGRNATQGFPIEKPKQSCCNHHNSNKHSDVNFRAKKQQLIVDRRPPHAAKEENRGKGESNKTALTL